MVRKSSKDVGPKGVKGSPLPSPRNKGAHSFGREYSLKEDLVIKRVFNSGKRFQGNCLTIYYMMGKDQSFKVALKVPKSNGSAPRRNTIKRIIRELIRTRRDKYESFGNIVIVAKLDEDIKSPFAWLEKDLNDFANSL